MRMSIKETLNFIYSADSIVVRLNVPGTVRLLELPVEKSDMLKALWDMEEQRKAECPWGVYQVGDVVTLIWSQA